MGQNFLGDAGILSADLFHLRGRDFPPCASMGTYMNSVERSLPRGSSSPASPCRLANTGHAVGMAVAPSAYAARDAGFPDDRAGGLAGTADRADGAGRACPPLPLGARRGRGDTPAGGVDAACAGAAPGPASRRPRPGTASRTPGGATVLSMPSGNARTIRRDGTPPPRSWTNWRPTASGGSPEPLPDGLTTARL